jgi:hypothetical protein
MELKQNSISAKLYRWFYGTDSMPSNLCPYFWKLVVMYIFIVPFFVVTLPMFIFSRSEREWHIRIMMSVVIYAFGFICLLAIYAPITYLIWGIFEGNSVWSGFQLGGFITLGISTVLAIVFGISYLVMERKEKNRLKQLEYIWNENGEPVPNPDYVPYVKKPNIILAFISAKYNKYCPKVDWK